MSYKTIREVKTLTGATEKALRYYHEKKLLSPSHREASGRHEWLYDEQAVQRLQLIILYRKAGFSTEETGKLLDAGPDERAQIITGKLTELQDKRRDLDAQISMVGMLHIGNQFQLGDKDYQAFTRFLSKLMGDDLL